MIVEITSENFESITSENEIVMIDFWAAWCGPCRMLGPIVDAVDENNSDDNVVIGKANVDSEDVTELTTTYKVRNLPTIIFFKNGEPVERIVGVKSKEDIEAIIEKLR